MESDLVAQIPEPPIHTPSHDAVPPMSITPGRPDGLRAAAAALLACTLACGGPDTREPDGPGLLVEDLPAPVARDWADIAQGDTLRALLVNNSTSYFIYRGEAMGYEFRALRRFADDNDLVLKVVPVDDRTELFRRLNEGEGDVAAGRLIPSETYDGHVLLTGDLYRTRPSLVQRDGAPDGTIFPDPIDSILDREDFRSARLDSLGGRAIAEMVQPIRHPRELVGEQVYLPRSAEYVERLAEIYDDEGETVEIVEVDRALSAEPLIRGVARGAIRFTVAPANVAELKEDYYENITAAPTVGPRHPVTWAVRTSSTELQRRLDGWIETNGGEEGYLAELYDEYFVDRASYNERVASEYLTTQTGRLSEHDGLLFDHARALGWDWRLLASQAFQESRFNPRAESWAGARGILQLMPGTARDMGVRNSWDPEENVEGAVRYLAWLEERWSERIPDPDQRLRFVLASYNAGFGHVEDAQRMAEKYGDDPNDWESVAFWMLQLSKRRYYTDPVVRYGYVRGLEPVTYVALILERFEHYQEFVAELPSAVDGDQATAD